MNTPGLLHRLLPALFFTALLPAQETGSVASPKPTDHPFLWRFEHEGVSHYLFGTIHLPDPRVTTLPAAVNQAREEVDALFLEVPPAQMADPSIAARMMLKDGKSLTEHVGPAVADKLKAYCEATGAPMAMLERMKPWVVSMQVSLAEVMAKYPGKPALDQQLAADAKELGQDVLGLETAAQQFDALDSFSMPLQTQMLEQALDEHASGANNKQIERMVQLYLAGDSRKLLAFTREHQPSKEVGEMFDKVMLKQRNAHMADGILKAIQGESDRACFFAVGAAHVQGKGGIVELLRAKGIELQRLNGAGEPVADHPAAAGGAQQGSGSPAGGKPVRKAG